MSTDLEKKFFDTFGIEPKYTYLVTDMFYTSDSHTYGATKNDLIDYFGGKNCGRYKVMKVYKTYPQITDRILLELICILNNYGKNDTWAISVENLKDCILMNCIKVIKEKDLKEMSLNNFKHQVRTLFEEGSND